MTKITKKVVFAIFATTFLAFIIFPPPSICQVSSYPYLGFAGYVSDIDHLGETCRILSESNLNVYRISFRPSWQVAEGEYHGYNPQFIDYLLERTNFFIIVDGNHLYPPGNASSQEAVEHWNEVEARIFQILERYPNNQRVAVELINEYVGSDYNTRIQSLIDDIRAAGYTNPIVTNKWETAWHKFNDPIDNTYQGMHFYFNHWDPDRAKTQLDYAKARGISKLINTEVGASSDEASAFNEVNVGEVSEFLEICEIYNVSNCIWMNNDAANWNAYKQNGLAFSKPSAYIITMPTPTPVPTPEPPLLEPNFNNENLIILTVCIIVLSFILVHLTTRRKRR